MVGASSQATAHPSRRSSGASSSAAWTSPVGMKNITAENPPKQQGSALRGFGSQTAELTQVFPPAAQKLVPFSASCLKGGAYLRRPPKSWCLFPPAASKLVPISAGDLKISASFRQPPKSWFPFPPAA